MKNKNLVFLICAMIFFSIFINGCGGSSSGFNDNDEYLSKTGVAVDPYIIGAKFFIDSNLNGICDTDEIISGFSNDSGEFEFNREIKKGEKVVMHPLFKGKHIEVDYSGPILEGKAEEKDVKGRVIFSPLTTLASRLDISKEDIAYILNNSFNFTSEVSASDILSDPMAHLPQNGEEPDHEQLRVIQAAIAVNGLLELLEKPSVNSVISNENKKDDIKELLIPIASDIKSVLSVEKFNKLKSIIPSEQPEFDIDALVRTAVSVNNKTIDTILSSVSGSTISDIKTSIKSTIDTDENSINAVKLGIATYITDNFDSITDKNTIISNTSTEIINAGGEDPTSFLNSVTQNTIISDNTFTLTLSTDGNGTITQGGLYSCGQTIEITANPSTNYVFLAFREGDDIISQQNPFVYTMLTREVTLTAYFTINTQYNLNYSAGDGGTISGTAAQTITHGSDGTTVTAVPDIGYRFVKWSDDVTTATRTDTNITSALNVTAYFIGDFAGGAGTSEDPYQISTPAQLDNIRNIPGKYYKLTADIDLGVAPYNEGTGWQPIGNHESYFYGSLDGNNCTISNLTINNPKGEYLGLFGKVFLSDYIKNISLTNVSISGKQYIGGLAGEIGAITLQTPDVINCSVSGTITASGAGEAGGLIGKAGAGLTITNSSTDINITGKLVGGFIGKSEADISACHSAGTVTQIGSYEAGGLIGILKDADLTSSYSTANVNGYRLVGGLVGWVDSFAKDILIEFCYATGNINVNITTSGGGLIALVQNTGETTTVRNCYATGNLTGVNSDSQLGGLIGKWADNEGSIINCYSIGHLSNAHNLGGLISSNVGGATITSSYWDTVTSGQTTSADGTGKSSAQMSQQATFTDWDFTSIWSIDEGSSYPYLQIQTGSNIPENELFAGGDGTELNPFQISTPSHLNNIRYFLTSYFVLNNDIDLAHATLSSEDWYDSVKGWDPIGYGWDESNMFFGKFNGNGKTISNLYINRSDEDFIGLFGSAIGNSTKNISNVFLSNVNLTGRNTVGGLCGASIGVISEVGVTGNITCVNDVGGVVGMLGADFASGSLDNSFSNVDIYSTGTSHIGGLVGYSYDSDITNCYSVGQVTGTSAEQLKGLVGSISASPIISNSFWDTVTSGQTTSAGGTGKSSAQMSQQATFTDWDFTSVWAIDEGNSYPYLQIFGESSKIFVTKYTLTTTVNNDSYGTVTPGGQYLAGQEIELITTDIGNYKFSYWNGDTDYIVYQSPDEDSGIRTARIIMPSQNISLEAYFSENI